MKPKSEVHLIDCMEFLGSVPDKFYSLACVDVPYTDNYDAMKQISVSNNAKAGDYHYSSLTNAKPTDEYWKELKRVSKNQIVWGANYLIENLTSTPCVIVWDKNNSGNFADCEIAFATFTTGAKIFKYTWNGMIQQNMKDKEERIHPTQKPVALYDWIFRNYAKPNDTILDTHMGSQSSRISAYKAGLDYTGCELDPEYFEQGNERFNAFLKKYGTPDPDKAIPGQQINIF
jgi:site-specific DNA-methyltransferase (adenine-specific)